MKALALSVALLTAVAPAAFAKTAAELSPLEVSELNSAIPGINLDNLTSAQISMLQSALGSDGSASARGLYTSLTN